MLRAKPSSLPRTALAPSRLWRVPCLPKLLALAAPKPGSSGKRGNLLLFGGSGPPVRLQALGPQQKAPPIQDAATDDAFKLKHASRALQGDATDIRGWGQKTACRTYLEAHPSPLLCQEALFWPATSNRSTSKSQKRIASQFSSFRYRYELLAVGIQFPSSLTMER